MNNTTGSPLPDYTEFCLHQKIRLTLMVPTVVAGLVGNAVVVAVILYKTRKNNDDIFLLNLACADFLRIAIDTSRFILNLTYVGPVKKTVLWCKVFWPLFSVPFCAGIFTITAMSLHRWLVIVNPFKPKIRLLWIKLCILSTWGTAVVFYLPITISAENNLQENGCYFQGWSPENLKAYSIASATIQYPLPLLVTTIAYLKICHYLRTRSVPQRSIIVKDGKLGALKDETRKDSITMTKTVAVIVVLFAVLLLPLQVAKVLYFYGIRKFWLSGILWKYGDVFSSMHCAIDPYLYAIRTRYYRRHISSWFRRQTPTDMPKFKRSTMVTSTISGSGSGAH